MVRSVVPFACCILATFVLPSHGQSIQRCEGPGGKITYSNAECPEGTKAVKSVAVPPPPTPDAQQAARTRAASDAARAQKLATERQVQHSQAQTQQAQAQYQRQTQQDADCAYLRGEIDSMRRLRNALTNRPYYSLDDLEQMDQHAARLIADYRRVCSP